jgi:hypothetical protein
MVSRHCEAAYLLVSLLVVMFIGANFAYSGDIAGKLKKPDFGNTQIITLNDGSSVKGEITEIGNDEIVFQTDMGKFNIKIAKIMEIKEVPESTFKGGQYWFPNPNRTRLYFSQTGRLLRKGEGYFSDWYLFFPGVNYGLTDNITVGGGFSIFPGLNIPDEQFLYLMPKIGLSVSEKADFAVSGLLVFIPNFDEDDTDAQPDVVGTVFGLGTFGSDDHNITFGLGFGFADEDFSDKPTIIIGGETRVARRMSLVGEGWLLPGIDEPLVAYGTRFFGEGISVDLAFLTIIGSDGIFPGIPYLGFVYNF